jgi:hypothetical protein
MAAAIKGCSSSNVIVGAAARPRWSALGLSLKA